MKQVEKKQIYLGLDPYLDPPDPATANADSVEFGRGILLSTLGFSVYNTIDAVACTRAANPDPWLQRTTPNTSYWESSKRGWQTFQGVSGKAYHIHKSISAINSLHNFRACVTQPPRFEVSGTTDTHPGIRFQLTQTSGGLPDPNNRVQIGYVNSGGMRLVGTIVVGGATTNFQSATIDPSFTPSCLGILVNQPGNAVWCYGYDPCNGGRLFLLDTMPFAPGAAFLAGLNRWTLTVVDAPAVDRMPENTTGFKFLRRSDIVGGQLPWIGDIY